MPEYVLGVHIDLPDHISQAILQARTELSIASYWGNYEITPHITIYVTAFPEAVFTDCKQTLKRLDTTVFEIKLTNIAIVENKNRNNIFVMLALESSNALTNFHKTIVKTINPFREGLIRSKDQERIKNNQYSPEEVAVIKKYGYLRVFDRFTPHITIGELPDPNTELIKNLHNELKEITNTSFLVTQYVVGLYKYNSNRNDYDYNESKPKIIPLKNPG